MVGPVTVSYVRLKFAAHRTNVYNSQMALCCRRFLKAVCE
jgi:hypothetical protein